MITVSADPTFGWIEALVDILRSDAALVALATGGIYQQLPQASRTTPPYVVFGRRHRDGVEAGTLSRVGSNVTVDVDVWSRYKGPYEASQILSRITVLFERRPTLAIAGFDYIEGSLTCEMSDLEWEPDTDAPEMSVWHGVQRWAAMFHEAA